MPTSKWLIWITVAALGLVANSSTEAQISTTNIAEPAIASTSASSIERPAVYDGSKNFLGMKPEGYIGQELYLLENPSYLNVHKWSSRDASRFDALSGHYFAVKNVHFNGNERIFLELQDKADGRVYFYWYDPASEWLFPFVVVSYYEKLKKNHIGKQYSIPSSVIRVNRPG